MPANDKRKGRIDKGIRIGKTEEQIFVRNITIEDAMLRVQKLPDDKKNNLIADLIWHIAKTKPSLIKDKLTQALMAHGVIDVSKEYIERYSRLS